jgi:ABC-type glutathione transport system ATPase component
MKNLTIKGACQHNLKNINVEIPRDKLVVITGVSGFGKSTLAFDTLYAEGLRRYWTKSGRKRRDGARLVGFGRTRNRFSTGPVVMLRSVLPGLSARCSFPQNRVGYRYRASVPAGGQAGP